MLHAVLSRKIASQVCQGEVAFWHTGSNQLSIDFQIATESSLDWKGTIGM